MTSREHQGRAAGLLYLLLAATSTVGLSIPRGFTVRADAAAPTARMDLRHPVPATGAYGRVKPVQTITMTLDDAAGFVDAVRVQMAET